MRIALASSAEPKEWFTDLPLLIEALAKHRVEADIKTWNDPGVKWATYDAVIVHSTWDYTERYDEFIQWCVEVSRQTRLINDLEIIQLNSNKRYLLELQSAGITTPRTAILPRGTDIVEGLEVDGEVVIKPLIGAGGSNTLRFPGMSAAHSSRVFQELHASHDLLVQEFVPAIRTHGEYSAVFMGGTLSHCVLKRPTGNEFRVQFDYGGVTKIATAPDFVNGYYNEIMQALNCRPVYARLDFILTGKPILMEVEMIEPDLFTRLHPEAATRLAETVIHKLQK